MLLVSLVRYAVAPTQGIVAVVQTPSHLASGLRWKRRVAICFGPCVLFGLALSSCYLVAHLSCLILLGVVAILLLVALVLLL